VKRASERRASFASGAGGPILRANELTFLWRGLATLMDDSMRSGNIGLLN
jgi:hypothetical protein